MREQTRNRRRSLLASCAWLSRHLPSPRTHSHHLRSRMRWNIHQYKKVIQASPHAYAKARPHRIPARTHSAKLRPVLGSLPRSLPSYGQHPTSACRPQAPACRHVGSILSPMTHNDSKTTAERVKYTEKWAVTMTKVEIRKAVKKTPFPHWHLLTFPGPNGRESRGVVDMIAIRKDHSSTPRNGLKKGDALQIVLIQIKGGSSRKPKVEDGVRLRRVCDLYHARGILYASWKKGSAAEFFSLSTAPVADREWTPVLNLATFLSKASAPD
jgi:hypothetical protein